jgi:DNA-binding winged helix-turn-helix (wHTH) protein
VLCALVRQPGSLLSTHNLLDEVWGHQFVTDSVLRTAISELRTVLDDDARKPRFIETVSRRGYRFIAATGPSQRARAIERNLAAGRDHPALTALGFVPRRAALADSAWSRPRWARAAVLNESGEASHEIRRKTDK